MKLYLSNGKTVVVASNGRLTIEPVTTTITPDGNVFVYKYPSGEQIGTPTHFSEVFQSDGVTSIGSTLALAQDYLIANTVFNTAPGGSGAPTAVIEISSAQILSMGSNPIELLPAPGVNKYILIDKILFISKGNTIDYTLEDLLYMSGANDILIVQSLITGATSAPNNLLICPIVINSIGVLPSLDPFMSTSFTNTNIILSTLEGGNPTDGDGTITVKIWYSIIDFS